MESNITNDPYILIAYESNWADEMDIYGYYIETNESWELTKKAVKEYFEGGKDRELNHYVGTNESITYDSYESWLNRYTTLPIPNEEILNYLKIIPDFSGHFFYPDWDDEEDKE